MTNDNEMIVSQHQPKSPSPDLSHKGVDANLAININHLPADHATAACRLALKDCADQSNRPV